MASPAARKIDGICCTIADGVWHVVGRPCSIRICEILLFTREPGETAHISVVKKGIEE